MTHFPPPKLRREALRDALPGSLDMLHRRRASEIPKGYIDDYVALRWLEWHGGSLRATTVGRDLCSRVVGRWAEAADAP